MLNDVYGSARVDEPGPGAVEMAWFASELADSVQDFQKVWVVMHIPPGTDAASSASSFETSGEAAYKG